MLFYLLIGMVTFTQNISVVFILTNLEPFYMTAMISCVYVCL